MPSASQQRLTGSWIDPESILNDTRVSFFYSSRTFHSVAQPVGEFQQPLSSECLSICPLNDVSFGCWNLISIESVSATPFLRMHFDLPLERRVIWLPQSHYQILPLKQVEPVSATPFLRTNSCLRLDWHDNWLHNPTGFQQLLFSECISICPLNDVSFGCRNLITRFYPWNKVNQFQQPKFSKWWAFAAERTTRLVAQPV